MTNARNGDTLRPAKTRPDVAIYLDFENLYVSLKTTAKMDPNFDLLMEKCREFGRVALARAYADWSEFSRIFTSQMFANGFEPVYVPTRKVYDARNRSEARKNSVDIHITIDIIKSLYLHEHVDVIILISGDRDYVPLINQIRQSGKSVYAIGVAGCTSSELSIAVDEMFFYHQLLDTGDKSEKTVDVYNQLLRALRIAGRRSYPTTLGILKPIMKELIEGFDERNYKNGRGQPFQKFKDLVQEAEKRRLVKLVTSGPTNEVFLWAEAPKPGAAAIPSTSSSSRRDDTASGRTSRGRRRPPRRAEATTADGETAERNVIADHSANTEAAGDTAATTADAIESPAAPAAASQSESGADAAVADDASGIAPGDGDDRGDRLTGLSLDDRNWEILARSIGTFDKPPTPRKLVNQLKKERTAKAFGDVRPTDADLLDLIGQCVDAGRLRRERKGFSTVLLLIDSSESSSTVVPSDQADAGTPENIAPPTETGAPNSHASPPAES